MESSSEKKPPFRLEDWPGVAMHCPEEWQAEKFCEFLGDAGREWRSGGKFSEDTKWGVYKDRTCYAFNEGMYGPPDCYLDDGYKLLEFSDFDWSDEPTIKDSGERTEYSTGAVRDCKEGKGRCDLMPLDVVARYFRFNDMVEEYRVFAHLSAFKNYGDIELLFRAVQEAFPPSNGNAAYSLMLEVSKHFEEGAKKYGPDNWQKGIPVHSYIDSAIRHYLKYRAAWTDEPHDRAFVWNLMCCIWTMTHHPELDDWTDKREKSKTEE